jgi:site-specific DNA-cytosine methylase
MNILVLFDGAGLSRLGLESAGHQCLGVELDPTKHELSRHLGSDRCVLAEARAYARAHLSEFDAVWASPPCVRRISCIKDLTKADGLRDPQFQGNHLRWCLSLPVPILWVENVTLQGSRGNGWGRVWNAAQFLREPRQNRNRIIGGRYPEPHVLHPYRRCFPGICPTITATEYKASGATDKCRASRFYGRNLTVEECAWHQGLTIPRAWYGIPEWFRPDDRFRGIHWRRNLYVAIGNAVPVYMARAFGAALLHHGQAH